MHKPSRRLRRFNNARLKELRERAGLTKSALAGKISRTHKQISRLENGEVKMPQPATLDAIVALFGVDVDELLLTSAHCCCQCHAELMTAPERESSFRSVRVKFKPDRVEINATIRIRNWRQLLRKLKILPVGSTPAKEPAKATIAARQEAGSGSAEVAEPESSGSKRIGAGARPAVTRSPSPYAPHHAAVQLCRRAPLST